MGRFYVRFATAYGTLWLVAAFIAVTTHPSVRPGIFDYWGFPIVAIILACVATVHGTDNAATEPSILGIVIAGVSATIAVVGTISIAWMGAPPFLVLFGAFCALLAVGGIFFYAYNYKAWFREKRESDPA